MTASKVYTLEERIKHLEGTVQEVDPNDEEEAASLAELEEQVARAAAKVASNEQQVFLQILWYLLYYGG